jgi:isoaspartyl peptidase/L-asparaginase-like protein (Ntn-hydrolase superfamily)
MAKMMFFIKTFSRYVMEETDHTFVVGGGAEELLDRAGLDRVNQGLGMSRNHFKKRY